MQGISKVLLLLLEVTLHAWRYNRAWKRVRNCESNSACLYLEVKLKGGKFEWCVLNLECNKKGKKNFFTGKETTCKIPPSFFRLKSID